MSTSGDEDSIVSNENNPSDPEISSGEEDFPSEQPRKKRRLTPPSETKQHVNGKTLEPSLSRVKVKRDGFHPGIIPTTTVTSGGVSKGQEKTSFVNLNVKPWLVSSLANIAISKPTGIQKGCIPEILRGRDCIGGSRTGSGKTVAFAVPMLQKWAEDRKDNHPNVRIKNDTDSPSQRSESTVWF